MSSGPTLLVLAAGLGSRYGGIKQMDPVGPDGEFVLDYSLYDAWKAGFTKAVLVVRDGMQEALNEHFRGRLQKRLQLEYAVQRLDDLPAGFSCPASRKKPWGTGHAIWSARQHINTPFAAINADDFYGRDAYLRLGEFLRGLPPEGPETYAMVAYRLSNTLSEHGTVSRGICEKTAEGFLQGVVERTSIEAAEPGARFRDTDGSWQPLRGDELASMNFWGFDARLFGRLESLFVEFLQAKGNEEKSEFYIPTVVDTLIQRQQCRVRVLETDERWFGMTYAEDRPLVVSKIADLTASGVYPHGLWN